MSMKSTDLLRVLDEMDRQGIWALDTHRLALLFPDEGAQLNISLSRHARTGLIKRLARGVYVNPRARSMPAEPLLAASSFLRPFDFAWLSLESVLSEAGWISQIPMRYTMMTTGRSGVLETAYGVIEFTHSSCAKGMQGIYFDPARACYVATPERAYSDLRNVGRNLDLLELPEMAQ